MDGGGPRVRVLTAHTPSRVMHMDSGHDRKQDQMPRQQSAVLLYTAVVFCVRRRCFEEPSSLLLIH